MGHSEFPMEITRFCSPNTFSYPNAPLLSVTREVFVPSRLTYFVHTHARSLSVNPRFLQPPDRTLLLQFLCLRRSLVCCDSCCCYFSLNKQYLIKTRIYLFYSCIALSMLKFHNFTIFIFLYLERLTFLLCVSATLCLL